MALADKPKFEAPLFDFVTTITPQTVAQYAQDHPKDGQHLGIVIALMAFEAATHLLDPRDELAKHITIHPDVMAFEGCIFAIYLNRYAYDACPGNGDDELGWHEKHSDAFMDSVWELAYNFIVSRADQCGICHARAIFRHRLAIYMHRLIDVRKVTEYFISMLEEVRDCTQPRAEYPGPFSLEIEQHIALKTIVMLFVWSVPLTWAHLIKDFMQIVDWRAGYKGMS